MRPTAFAFAPLLLALAGVASAADTNCPAWKNNAYRTGLWEVTTTSTNPMMPKPMTHTMKHCVTPEDAANACNFAQQEKQKNCKMTDFKLVGNHASWTMTCNERGMTMNGKGESTFSQDAYAGKVDMTMNGKGMNMTMSSSFKGRRLGDCTK